MKYYTTTTEFNCGIDLRSRQMYICVMDCTGKKLVHTNIKDNDFDYFLKLVKPYRHDLTVCCECIFNWYWLADACLDAGFEFVLTHALYMKAKHGKYKANAILANKLARAVYYMLKSKTVFDPERIITLLTKHKMNTPNVSAKPQRSPQDHKIMA